MNSVSIYDDYYSNEKDKVNQMIAKEISKSPGITLYLDSINMRTTKALRDHHIYCNSVIVEHNKEYYDQMKIKADKLGIKIYYGNIYDYINTINPTNLYLDLCCSDINNNNLLIITNWLNNKINGNLFITLSSRSCKTFKQRRIRLKRAFSRYNYKLKLVWGYKRKPNSLTMMVLHFKYNFDTKYCEFRPQSCKKIEGDYYWIKCWCFKEYEKLHKDTELVQYWIEQNKK